MLEVDPSKRITAREIWQMFAGTPEWKAVREGNTTRKYSPPSTSIHPLTQLR